MDTGTNKKPASADSSQGTVTPKGNEEEVCKVLCGVLLEGIDVHRVLAAQALGKIGGDEAVETLIKALLDEDEDVRTDAASALAGLKDSRADKQLLENLIGDPCSDVKLSAMSALAATNYDEAKPWLMRILAGRDEEIAWDEEEFYASGWDDWLDMQLKAMRTLADLGVEDAVPVIVEAINDDDAHDITDTAMKALARIGPSGIGALAAYLENTDPRLRRHAASVVARCDGAVAENAINKALQDSSSDVRLAVARGLAEKRPDDERLAILLVDEDPSVRAEAVRLFGAHHESRLDLLLDDKDMDVRLAVLEVLADHPELKHIPVLGDRLRDLLQSPTESVAAAAAAAFAILDAKDVVSELAAILENEDNSGDIRRGAIRGLKAVGDDAALQALAGILGCDDRQIRLDSMAAIAEIAGSDAWPNAAGDVLLTALAGELIPAPETEEDGEETKETPAAEETADDEAEEENAEAVETEEDPEDDQFPTSTLDSIVGRAKTEASAPPPEDVEMTPEDLEFMSLTHGKQKGRKRVPLVPDVNPYDDVPLFAARLLGDFPHPDVSLALLEPLSGGDAQMKQTAAESLAHLAQELTDFPTETLEALQAEAKSQTRDIRLQAVRALGCTSDKSVVMVLINTLDDGDSFVRTEAIRSLGRLGEAGPGVSRLLEDPDASVRLVAAKALAQTEAPGVVETLGEFAFAFEGYHGRHAARLLADVDRQAANAFFIKALNDEERKRYWKVAIEALEELNRKKELGLSYVPA